MLSYAERLTQTSNPAAKQLLATIARKRSNLAVSADVTSKRELFALVAQVAPYISVLKTHIDIISDADEGTLIELTALAEQHDFVLFEDRKFADIGNTVRLQYSAGVHHIADWAHIVDAHPLPGPGIVEGLREVGLSKGRGLLLLAQMSSADNLFTEHYTEKAISMAEQYPDFVIGFICQHRLTDKPHLLHFTPGVQLSESSDQLGQRYITPAQAIHERGSDIIIVGRGIYQAADPAEAAERYRDQAWVAYQASL